MARLHPLEKLAREICWQYFADPNRVGITKAAYWNRLPEETRASYRAEAERFVYLRRRIPDELFNIHQQAAKEQQ